VKRSPDALWDQITQIVDALSNAMPTTRENARTALLIEVQAAVDGARLPPHLKSDPVARREIAAQVVRVLEAKDQAHLREWRRRVRHGDEPSSWGTFLRVVIAQQAILYDHRRRR